MLFLLIKSAEYSITYSSRLARSLRMSEFLISFFIVAVISVFPETTISIVSSLKGVPELGLGTLIGSNITDLTLVLGIVVLLSKRDGLTIQSKILRKDFVYLILLLLPVLLGFDAHFSRIDGLILIISCIIFFISLYIEGSRFKKTDHQNKYIKNSFLLLISLAFLLTAAYYTVEFGVKFAEDINFPPLLIGLVVFSIGVCLPEMLFSIKAVKRNHNTLALGDLLGTVIIDATLIIGILALINPFDFDPLLIYIAGSFMFISGLLVIIFIKTGRQITKREAIYLIGFYILYLIVELSARNFLL